MKNGFYHNQPADEDIYVDESMVPVIGHSSINGHVENTRHEGINLVADVTFEGHTYKVVRRHFGAEGFWTIIQGTTEEPASVETAEPVEDDWMVNPHPLTIFFYWVSEIAKIIYQREQEARWAEEAKVPQFTKWDGRQFVPASPDEATSLKLCNFDFIKTEAGWKSNKLPESGDYTNRRVEEIQALGFPCEIVSEKRRGFEQSWRTYAIVIPLDAFQQEDDEELSTEDLAAIESAMSQEDMGPYTMEKLEAMMEQAQAAPNDISIYPMCGHRYSIPASTSVEEIADLKTQMCPDCVKDMVEFEAACEAEYQASLVQEAQPEILYTVADDRLALPVHYLSPNAVTPEWYSPCQFSGIREASDAFVAHHGKPARYVDPYQFGVICKLRMEEWEAWENVPDYTDRFQRLHNGHAAFAQAVAMYASQQIDPFELDIESVWDWQKADKAFIEWEVKHPQFVAIV